MKQRNMEKNGFSVEIGFKYIFLADILPFSSTPVARFSASWDMIAQQYRPLVHIFICH